jgi:hypothetical protein
MPGYGKENNQQYNGKPNGHGFELLLIGYFSFGFCRANGQQYDRDHHHGDMLHTKEPDLPLVHRLFKIIQKIPYHRADEIQDNAYYQLNMRGGNRHHAGCIIHF